LSAPWRARVRACMRACKVACVRACTRACVRVFMVVDVPAGLCACVRGLVCPE
jgi:hypothetical protein